MSSGIPGQRFIPFDNPQPFKPNIPLNEQIMREVKLSHYSKPVYQFCKYYFDKNRITWNESLTHFLNDLNKNLYDETSYYINLNLSVDENILVAERYIENHKKQYDADKSGGRSRSKKRPTARRRRSSKSRKSRATRRR